jgi:WD40 repeat protein
VSGSDDKTVRIWNVTTGEVEAELKGHTDLVTSVSFSQDGSQVVSGSMDKIGPNLECDDRRGGG